MIMKLVTVESDSNKPHVNDLNDYVGKRNRPLLIDIIQKQFEVANHNELPHPTLANATWLWNLHYKHSQITYMKLNTLVDLK